MRKVETFEENRKWVPSVWRNENMKGWERKRNLWGFEQKKKQCNELQKNKEGWSFEECGEWDHEAVSVKLN